MITHPLPDAPHFNLDAAPRDWLPTPDRLVQACADSIAAAAPDDLDLVLTEMGAPLLDLIITPLTTRAALMAAEYGRAFYHHELRRRLPMPADLGPEITVWEAGTTPVWSDGVLAEPKYFSFFQDAPFPAYNPNHRRKWRAHELLHGASRFYWHPEMTRFEFYVSARLNELVPVVHWYGLDEVFRPRCKDHEDQVLHRAHCLRCQAAAIPYWESTAHQNRARLEAAKRHVEHSWSHFDDEWQAITEEISTGLQIASPRPYLDASSDAVAYMRAHWNRVTAWSFGTWAELFLVDGLDYFSRLEALRENVGRTMHRLVSGSVEVDPEVFKAQRARCQLQDLGYRTLLALEWLDPDSDVGRRAEQALMPGLEAAAQISRDLIEDPTRVNDALEQFARICHQFSTLAPSFPEEVADAFLAFGYRFFDPQIFATAATGQVFSGLEDGLPATMDRVENPVEVVQAFANSTEFDTPGRLSGRFAQWLASQPDVNSTLIDLARFEAFINAEPRSDAEAENFAAIPRHASDTKNLPGRLRPHQTLRRGRFLATTLQRAAALEFDESGPLPVAAVWIGGEPRILVEDAATTQILDRLQGGEPVESWWDFGWSTSLMILLENRFLTWLPAPRY